ncbi:VSP [Giardia duodenalis]|uniref:VSP n=1 Tax=Giardia intestinalis (strain ATCC 50803 / WB clone C6) TaxID=184922 RepID=A0A644F702_GIAIC|nr:VSP [Giardia intestinalis]XP_037902096.1 VSP [Giardia intestinalis]KAE8304422.1 VSP [Giardia intestinalis]KAE8304423.1 VSP [Giardia intestinalis]
MFGSFIFAGLAIQIAWAEKVAERAREAHCANNANCAANACNVLIGGKLYCSQCNTGFVPINGKCVGKDDVTDKCTAADGNTASDETCAKCAGQTFMYKGGCYEQAIEPGNVMCGGAAGGKCTQATEGYFLPPGADNAHDSVVSCGDSIGVTLTGNKKYTGVDGCTACDGLQLTVEASGVAKCTACGPDAQQTARIVKTDGDVTSCVTEHECTSTAGFFVDATGSKKCTKCAETCKTCETEATKCTSCNEDKPYLKKAQSQDQAGECVTEEACTSGNTHYADDEEPKTCKPCTAGTFENCKTCTKSDTSVTCTACKENMVFGLGKKSCISSCPDNSEAKTENTCTCNDGFKLDEEETQCVPNDSPSNPCSTQDCKACSGAQTNKEICTECLSNKYLTPTNQCIDHCEYILGYYSSTEGNKRVCKKCEVANCLACSENGGCGLCKDGFYGEACSPCDSSCKTCSGNTANDCTSCKSGSALTYGSTGNTGTCGAECAAGTGTGKCRECGLTVEGTKYCSVCSQNNEYPQNGVCAVKTSRTDKCKDGSITGGVCNVCADGFFKMNGGCYSTSQLPGSTVCLSAQSTGGTCKTPEEGFSLTGESLVACYTGCAECTTTRDCSRCMDGYVKVGSACTKCHESCYTCEADATTCKVCTPGYYKESSSNGPCRKCSEGLAGCRQCATPVNGKFICFETDDNTGDNTGGSTNKSGLSTGAIAGISVAVIVVVGGLVGFLCWWFICRGKA